MFEIAKKFHPTTTLQNSFGTTTFVPRSQLAINQVNNERLIALDKVMRMTEDSVLKFFLIYETHCFA